MAIIYTYPLKATPIMADSVVITDTEDKNKTKITSLQAIASIITIPGTGTVKSVTLDFDSTNGTDTGLRLWNSGAVAFSDTSQTITNTGSFEVGGALFTTHGGTGLVALNYTDGDMLFYDSAGVLTGEQLVPLSVGGAGDGAVITLSGGYPTWAPAVSGSSWDISGGSTFTVDNGDKVSFVGAGGITTVVTDTVGFPPYTLTVDGSAIPIGVTEVKAVNNLDLVAGDSGFKFTTSPALGIIATGSVQIGFSGATGDILYADTPNTLKRLSAGADGEVLTIDATVPATPFPYWGPGGGGGGGNMAFSPINVAACGSDINLGQAVLYLTIAEHDMTIANCTVWGSNSFGSGNIEVAVYRYGLGGWGTGSIMGISPITICGYGPNDLTINAVAPETLTVTAGEWLIVGMVDKTDEPDWQSASHKALSNKMFGQVNIVPPPGVLPELTPPLDDSDEWFETDFRFALTLW
jgi:hypothetical protein